MKKHTAWILVAAAFLFVACIDGSVPQTIGGFDYAENPTGLTITGYSGPGGAVILPSNINGKPVTSIAASTDFHGGVFSGNQLTSVVIPDSVTSIGDYAFYDNQLTSVVIPDSVTTIGDLAFWGNQLTSVVIPDSVTTIGDHAFRNNQLTSVVIPNSVTTIGDYAFWGNQNLTAINVSLGNTVYCSDDGVLYNKNKTTLVAWPPKGKTSVIIPDSVTSIGNFAFWGNQLTSVVIPNSVTTIGNYAFWGNQLTSITIGANVSVGYNNGFDNGFDTAYNDGGKLAGTYARASTSSTVWVRQ